jgi:hypothetical protein
VCIHVHIWATTDLGKAVQIQIPLKGAEFFSTKVLGKHNVGEFVGIVNTEGFSRTGPANNSWMAR